MVPPQGGIFYYFKISILLFGIYFSHLYICSPLTGNGEVDEWLKSVVC